MKEYYNSKDIMTITGFKRTKSSYLIKEFNENLKNEYPNIIIINGRVPIWYWKLKTQKEIREYEEEATN